MTDAFRAAQMLSALLCVTATCRGAADTNEPTRGRDFVIRSWGTEAGLPQNSVNSILQTRDGYLWLATRDGVARFDGVRFTVFGLQEGLTSVNISTLYEDEGGSLLAGTIGGGLNRLVGGRFEAVRGPDGESAGDSMTALAEDKRGWLWIGTSEGIKLWNGTNFVEDAGLKDIARFPVRTFLLDREGRMWIATSREGLFVYEGGKVTPQAGPVEDPVVNGYCLLEDRKGQLWAGVGDGRVLCRSEGRWQVYTETNGLPFAYVTSLVEDAEGAVWAGSLDAGLYRFEQGHFRAITKQDGLSADDIRCLQTDWRGTVWVGTRTGGLNRLGREKLVHYGVAQGLTNDFTRSVAESADATLWVATTGGGLYQGKSGEFRPFAPAEIARYYAHVEAVLVADDGALWWGGAHALLCWKDGQFAGCYTNEAWIENTTVTALCDDHQGGVCFGTANGGLGRIERGRVTLFPQQVAKGPVTTLAQATNGFLWVGSPGGGLKRVRWGSPSVLSVTKGLRSQSILTLCLDGEGTLWIGTAGGGLSRYHGGEVATFTTQEGLGANTVCQIVDDDEGCLWLGCNHGVIRVRKAELEKLAARRVSFLHPRMYGLNYGMPTEECSSGSCPACLKTRSGRICLCTVKGLVLLDPKQRETNAPPPAVLLEETLLDGKVVDPTVSRSAAGTRGGRQSRVPVLVIPPGARELEIHYTGIDFSAPEKINFRYRLARLDPDWREAGGRRTAYYHRIPPGEYDFQAVACGANGAWGEPGAALRVTVRPYLWETAWFRVGAGLSLIGLLAGAARLVERGRYKRRLALMEMRHAVERERLRISQDMHDEIGSFLTQVSQLSDLGQTETEAQLRARGIFERIGTQARAAVQALDEIVWVTNPKNDNLPRFAEYVCRFADEFFEDTTVRCWQEVPTDLPKLPLGTELRHNLFLAIKEAFNNVLKHSGATEVWLRLALADTSVTLEIEDNGRGFNPQQSAAGRDGVDHMRTRLTDCGGQAEVISQPGKGTKLRFRFPLRGTGA